MRLPALRSAGGRQAQAVAAPDGHEARPLLLTSKQASPASSMRQPPPSPGKSGAIFQASVSQPPHSPLKGSSVSQISVIQPPPSPSKSGVIPQAAVSQPPHSPSMGGGISQISVIQPPPSSSKSGAIPQATVSQPPPSPRKGGGIPQPPVTQPTSYLAKGADTSPSSTPQSAVSLSSNGIRRENVTSPSQDPHRRLLDADSKSPPSQVEDYLMPSAPQRPSSSLSAHDGDGVKGGNAPSTGSSTLDTLNLMSVQGAGVIPGLSHAPSPADALISCMSPALVAPAKSSVSSPSPQKVVAYPLAKAQGMEQLQGLLQKQVRPASLAYDQRKQLEQRSSAQAQAPASIPGPEVPNSALMLLEATMKPVQALGATAVFSTIRTAASGGLSATKRMLLEMSTTTRVPPPAPAAPDALTSFLSTLPLVRTKKAQAGEVQVAPGSAAVRTVTNTGGPSAVPATASAAYMLARLAASPIQQAQVSAGYGSYAGLASMASQSPPAHGDRPVDPYAELASMASQSPPAQGVRPVEPHAELASRASQSPLAQGVRPVEPYAELASMASQSPPAHGDRPVEPYAELASRAFQSPPAQGGRPVDPYAELASISSQSPSAQGDRPVEPYAELACISSQSPSAQGDRPGEPYAELASISSQIPPAQGVIPLEPYAEMASMSSQSPPAQGGRPVGPVHAAAGAVHDILHLLKLPLFPQHRSAHSRGSSKECAEGHSPPHWVQKVKSIKEELAAVDGGQDELQRGERPIPLLRRLLSNTCSPHIAYTRPPLEHPLSFFLAQLQSIEGKTSSRVESVQSLSSDASSPTLAHHTLPTHVLLSNTHSPAFLRSCSR
eukprot:gene6564-3216_t